MQYPIPTRLSGSPIASTQHCGVGRLLPFQSRNSTPRPRVASLFAGIGGFEVGLAKHLPEIVFASEIDPYARETYRENHSFEPVGDIFAHDPRGIPDHDLLTAGFPCQAFSMMGKRGGYADERGMLAFVIPRVLEAKQPKGFLLENVASFLTHDQGKTAAVFMRRLEDAGYVIRHTILDAADFGVSQHRRRVYIVGFRTDYSPREFLFPDGDVCHSGIGSILESGVEGKFWLSKKYWDGLQARTARNAARGNGFGYAIISPDNPANTIVVGGSGRERNLVVDDKIPDSMEINSACLRRLTPRECARLQGFPDSFRIPVSDTQAYRQFGNAVAVPVIAAIADRFMPAMQAEAMPAYSLSA